MFSSIVLLVAGILACYGLIVSKVHSVKDELDAIIPYQGFVGVLLIFLFIFDLLFIGRTISSLSIAPIFGILQLLSMITKLFLGFVLSYGLITKYVLTAPTDAKEKTDKTYNTLIMVQIPFGILAILIGLTGLILGIIY